MNQGPSLRAALDQLLVDSTRIASRATAMPSGLPPKVEPWSPGVEDAHHLVAAQERATRDRSRRDSALPTITPSGWIPSHSIGEELAGAAESRLDLVADQQHVVLVAQLAQRAQEALRRHDDAGFALDGLDQEGDGLAA